MNIITFSVTIICLLLVSCTEFDSCTLYCKSKEFQKTDENCNSVSTKLVRKNCNITEKEIIEIKDLCFNNCNNVYQNASKQ